VMFFLLGIPAGIVASIVAWWILYRGIAPVMRFSSAISKTPATDIKSGFRYRFKVENAGSRTIVDVEFFAQLRIRGLRSGYAKIWQVLFVPLEYHRIPRMRPARKFKVRDMIRLHIEELDQLKSPLYSEEIQRKHDEGVLLLEDLLELGQDATLQVIAFGYDDFSGSRKVFESKFYRRSDITLGTFDPNSVEVLVVEQEDTQNRTR